MLKLIHVRMKAIVGNRGRLWEWKMDWVPARYDSRAMSFVETRKRYAYGNSLALY